MSAGIYLHIPFCKTRCSYCDFATDIYRDNDFAEKYIDALIREISQSNFRKTAEKTAEKHFSDSPFDTIYFGGGTPSLLSADQIERILIALGNSFDFGEDLEITIEINPGTISFEQMRAYRSLGINRASFGVQTFDENSLKLLGRGHTAEDSRKTFDLLRKAEFGNISFDLIGGLPYQTLEDWNANLEKAILLDPEHISLYLLEIHKGTPLAEQIAGGRRPQPDEDIAGEMYEFMLDRLSQTKLAQYEISNFAKPDHQSRHNIKYWLCEPVLGFGCSAHSFDGKAKRWSNVRKTEEYISLIENGGLPIQQEENLTAIQCASEFAYLGLRLNQGIDLNEYESRFAIDLRRKYDSEFARLEELGLTEFIENRLFLTKKGMLYSNEVFDIFV